MRILEGLTELITPPTGTIMTIGNFDGVHVGHRKIFSMVVEEAERIGGTPVLLTFKPHPTKILRPELAPPLLSTREQRYRMFREAGIEITCVLDFTHEFSLTTAQSFVEEIVVPRFAPKKILIGTPFRFGHDREGDVALLQEMGVRLGFEAEGVGVVDDAGRTISSTRIRRALLDGAIDEGNRMLGSPFELVGTVVSGEARGRKLTFPTANLQVENELIPADGVYVTRLNIKDVLIGSVTNIGTRPTFDEKVRVVESHALDFGQDLYDRRVALQFIERIRREMKFPSPEALVEQIKKDVARARKVLAAAHPTTPRTG